MASQARSILDRRTRPADLGVQEEGKVRCVACGHRCLLGEGVAGVCRVRFAEGGALRAPWGYVGSLALDPIEKKPFFHVAPGSAALSFGMYGCDLRCSYCQNWEISQAGRDEASDRWLKPRDTTPEELADEAVRQGASVVVSTYNEPLITAEWGAAVFREARSRGLLTAVVSNGHGTPEAVEYLLPWVDAWKVDLKGMKEETYRALGGRLGAVLETLRLLRRRGAWLEIVTLLVPGLNDSDGEVREAARFVASLGPSVPWHVTAFHPDYRMEDRGPTPPEALERACRIGEEEGLHFVYAGNVPGRTDRESTRCPGCGERVVQRRGYVVGCCLAGPDGECPACGRRLEGIWRPRGTSGGTV